jgi:hypothetical protein
MRPLPSDKETSVRQSIRGVLASLSCASLASIGACTSVTSQVQTGTCTDVGTLVVGDTLRDSVTASACRLTDGTYVKSYRFRVAAQTTLRISLSSPLQRAFLLTTDSDGVVIANTFITSPVDTAATLRLIATAGAYVVAVNTLAPAPSGPLRLVAMADTSAIRGCLPVWVTKGITTTQTITGSDCTTGPLGPTYYSHTFLTVVLGGGELKVTEHASGFTPQVVLVDRSGATLGTSALDASGTNALLDYSPGLPSALLMWVGSADALALGQYTLTIN